MGDPEDEGEMAWVHVIGDIFETECHKPGCNRVVRYGCMVAYEGETMFVGACTEHRWDERKFPLEEE